MVDHNDHDIVYFAKTDEHEPRRFGIRNADRLQHMYVIGKTGTGKSTLLENIAIQDITQKHGMCFIDTYGKTAELLLDYVPKERLRDVIYFSPQDTEAPLVFNVFEHVAPDQRQFVVRSMVALFKRLWADVWSSHMEYVLVHTVGALLEYEDATVLCIDRMLVDADFRTRVLMQVHDPVLRIFWETEFNVGWGDHEQQVVSHIHAKIRRIAENHLVRPIVGRPTSTFNVRKAMDERKIMLVNLARGKIGGDNADLLGEILLVKIYLESIARTEVTPAEFLAMPPFYLIIDEFQSFVSDSFVEMLSSARKYKLSFTLAHQYLEQIPLDVQQAILGNVGTVISFRIGPHDAKIMSSVFQLPFRYIENLGFGELYLSLSIDGTVSPPFFASALPLFLSPEHTHAREIVEHSRAMYGHEHASIERVLAPSFVTPPPLRRPPGKPPHPKQTAHTVSLTSLSSRDDSKKEKTTTTNHVALREAIAQVINARNTEQAKNSGEIDANELKRIMNE
ncbi:MAG: type IV secretion system DNA-binding domain-containing protein [bacterium]|nr:type IV secretion system DNA-binding domain-containing protein [bacterium]